MVNPNEAPEGYMAVQYTGFCDNCAFDNLESCAALSVSCVSYLRDDGKSVYFIPKKGTQRNESYRRYTTCAGVIPRISLRDYFAGCAITGLLAANQQGGCMVNAYEVADAMLEQREKALNGGDNAANN